MGDAADRPLHVVSVWNPSYVDDAMDQHLGVFLDWAERRDRGEADEEEVYVWWGNVRSEPREEQLPHADDILALSEQIERATETHLDYITDHRFLYVGQLVEITDEPILDMWKGEQKHSVMNSRTQPSRFCNGRPPSKSYRGARTLTRNQSRQ